MPRYVETTAAGPILREYSDVPLPADLPLGAREVTDDAEWKALKDQIANPPGVKRYVPLALIRDRVIAAGQWSAFATALETLPPEKKWSLQFLSTGIAPDDPDAVALLEAIGLDPAAVLKL